MWRFFRSSPRGLEIGQRCRFLTYICVRCGPWRSGGTRVSNSLTSRRAMSPKRCRATPHSLDSTALSGSTATNETRPRPSDGSSVVPHPLNAHLAADYKKLMPSQITSSNETSLYTLLGQPITKNTEAPSNQVVERDENERRR